MSLCKFLCVHVSVIHMTIIRSVRAKEIATYALIMVNGFGLTS